MFCALLTSKYQVSVYRTNGPLVSLLSYKKFEIMLIHFVAGIIPSFYIQIFKYLACSCNVVHKKMFISIFIFISFQETLLQTIMMSRKTSLPRFRAIKGSSCFTQTSLRISTPTPYLIPTTDKVR